MVIFYFIPGLFSIAIIVPLLMTLCKLRLYKKQYAMKINVKKVVVHLSVTILIFTFYSLRFLYMKDWMDLVLAQGSKPADVKNGIEDSSYLRMLAMNSILFLYYIPVFYLLVNFSKKKRV